MPHRLSAHGQVAFGPVELVRPRLAAKADVRVSGISQDDDGALWFRAEGGGVSSGIYRERGAGDAELIARDEGGAALFEPRSRGGVIVMKRALPSGAPSYPREIVFAREDGSALVVAGQSVATSGNGRTALVLDVPSKTLTHVDTESLSSREIKADGLALGMDPQQAPLLALDDEGAEALFFDAGNAAGGSGEAWLCGLSLADGAHSRLLGPIAAPSWLCGAFVPSGRGVLALSCNFGETPSTRMVWLGSDGRTREVFRSAVASPASVPAFLDEDTAVLPLSLAPLAMASYGPVDLVAVSLAGKAPVVITRSGDVSGSARVLANGEVVVEGGATLLRVSRA